MSAEENCGKCRGTGVRLYGSSSTYRGGFGGQAMTRDLCNACWGSGTTTPFRDINELYREIEKAKIASAIDELFRNRQGLFIPALLDGMRGLVEDIAKLSRKSSRPGSYRSSARVLEKTLREMIAVQEKRNEG